MQTFLPYPSFEKSAKCLDYRRLGKQRIEAWQIYLALTEKNYGWKNHPAVKMWSKYEEALLHYGLSICSEWRNRGFKDSMWIKFYREAFKRANWRPLKLPEFVGDQMFHASHRSNLLRKNYKYYKQFKWKEPRNLPYYWPINQRSKP